MPDQLDNPLDGRGATMGAPLSKWEEVDDALDRIAVPGGWLYRSANNEHALAFVPRDVDGDLVAAAFEMLVTLKAAEVFITGFEGDETQDPPVDLLLENIRAIVTQAEGRDDLWRGGLAMIMAAAPEMLAALRLASAIRPDNWDEGSDSEQEAAWRAVDAAIAQAEGR